MDMAEEFVKSPQSVRSDFRINLSCPVLHLLLQESKKPSNRVGFGNRAIPIALVLPVSYWIVNQQVKMTTQQQVKLTTSKHEKKVFIYPKIMSAFEVGEGADAHPRFPFIAS